jgi:hypothetical protein
VENRNLAEAENQDRSCQKHPGIKHLLMMAACCMVPLAGALTLNRMGYGGAASWAKSLSSG